ncbi:hypothetical protein J6590_086423, partial [Homalodisca vitripennis]
LLFNAICSLADFFPTSPLLRIRPLRSPRIPVICRKRASRLNRTLHNDRRFNDWSVPFLRTSAVFCLWSSWRSSHPTFHPYNKRGA